MEVKRLFIATFAAKYLFERHYSKLQEIFAPVCTGKWTELHNLHFTYKFLGNVEVEKIPEITELIKDKLIEYPGILKFNGLGVMRSPQQPSLLYARVHSPDKSVLTNFFELEKKLTAHGFSREKRKFMPHITLLRVKSSNENFADVYEKNKETYIGKQVNFKVSLVASTLTHEGPIYEIIA
ncbi:MAG: RNA 2',3'-cyclic phosphodiesterase [Candidatus Kapabacteria bacterium]|nr:RNA 2',3'-cyclic phosphodiesterase [Ignavibacteriota bacterium]MCW5886327.1 RNA 2',3'-cyclic phosphodiesterase [Candidatus Kapabacteria bacterium]